MKTCILIKNLVADGILSKNGERVDNVEFKKGAKIKTITDKDGTPVHTQYNKYFFFWKFSSYFSIKYEEGETIHDYVISENLYNRRKKIERIKRKIKKLKKII